MREPLRPFRSNKGAALLTSVMVMMMMAMLGVAYLALTSSDLLRSNRDLRRATAFYLAEAGLESIIGQIMSEGLTNGGIVIGRTYNTTPVLNHLSPGATGTVWVTAGPGGPRYASITSSAVYRGITETVQARVSISSHGVWNNAIFAGTGQTGRGINGNVDIRGSVHILGEGDPFTDLNGNGVRDVAEPFTDQNGNGVWDPGEPFVDRDGNGIWSPEEPYQDYNMNGMYDPPLTAHELAGDLSGTAYIGNNYYGMPASLRAKVPSLVYQDYGGEMVETLNTEVRVKRGRVNLSGTALIGSANVTGNNLKETVDGVYVSDGFGGNQGVGNVNSDNGTTQVYDMGDKVSFPSLQDDYTDPATGTHYGTYEDYLVANSLLIPVTKIDFTTESFSYTDGINSISWNKTTNTFDITGIVRVSGDIHLSSKQKTVNYTGSGTIFSGGSIYVHGSVVSVGTFPTQDALGCIAKYDIEFATGPGESQLEASGAWYAQRRIRSAKQSQFAGTYVANYFDMGNQVPNIYQVPELANHLPPGMPGGDTAISARILSWHHVRPSW